MSKQVSVEMFVYTSESLLSNSQPYFLATIWAARNTFPFILYP